jgi:hypothetical protein
MFCCERLESHGLTVHVPTTGDRATVHRMIYDELCLGVVRPESLRAYQQVVGRLVERGTEGVVLGCTEIELLVEAPADFALVTERSGTVEGPDTPGGRGWPPVFTGQRPARHGLRSLASNS